MTILNLITALEYANEVHYEDEKLIVHIYHFELNDFINELKGMFEEVEEPNAYVKDCGVCFILDLDYLVGWFDDEYDEIEKYLRRKYGN